MDLNTQQEVHLSHYWNVIRKRWKVAAAIVVVVMLGTFLASQLSTPLYRSTIQIEIERESNTVTVEDIFGIAASDQEFLQTQYVLLRSKGLGLQVVEDHKLYNDPHFHAAGNLAGKTPAEAQAIKLGIASALIAGIEVVPVRSTSLVEISYTGTNPAKVQKIAEAWGESYMRMNIAKKLNSVQQASEFLSTQIASVRSDLQLAREELTNYGRSRGIVSVEGGTENVVMSTLTQINSDLQNAQNMLYDKQAAFNALQRTAVDAVASSDPLVLRLTDDLSQQQRLYTEKQRTFLPGHPEMRQLESQMQQTRDQRNLAVRQAYGKAVEQARAEVSAAQARVTSLRNAYDGQRREVQRLNVDAARYLDLQMAVETKQAQLASLQKQLNETQVAARLSGAATSNINWVDHATFPTSRFNASMKKNLQSAFPLGVMLALGAIFFLEYMDRSVKMPEELERVTKFASLGVIPAASTLNRQSGYETYGRTTPRLRAVDAGEEAAGIELVPHTDARSPIAESYRAFRTSLLLASARSPKVIVITSSFAREGKTTTSVNLATVLAQMGKPVLLLDADLRRPRIQKVFPGKSHLGLVNFLAGGASLEEIVQPTEVPNLSVVLSGPIPPNPSELLASDRMKYLIDEARARFAYVIFDSPPVLAVTDAIVLGASADGVVLCVHGGKTPREHVQRSAERLRQAKIPVLGALLNNLDLHQYGYNYRKSYYDYYESADEEAQRKRKSS
jgi:succinoglycan biosynthesis transport protein ExoP